MAWKVYSRAVNQENHALLLVSTLEKSKALHELSSVLFPKKNPKTILDSTFLAHFHHYENHTPHELENLRNLSAKFGISLFFSTVKNLTSKKKLLAFDLDSTFIQKESLDEVAKDRGLFHEVEKITEAGMRGEIDFKESLQKRITLLKGTNQKLFLEVAEKLPLTLCILEVLKECKKQKIKTALLSSGSTLFTNYFEKKLGLDHTFGNSLNFNKNGELTNQLPDDLIDKQRKKEILRELMKKNSFKPEEVIAIGDGSNDLEMLRVAGLGICFLGKPVLQEQTSCWIREKNLGLVLALLHKDIYDCC